MHSPCVRSESRVFDEKLLEAGNLEGCRDVANDGSTVIGATDKVDRRSTSLGVLQLGGCTIVTYSRTQGLAALFVGRKLRDTPSGAVWQKSWESS